MGAILSKPVVYIKTKVDNTKRAIRKKITDTRDGIYNRIDNTKNDITNKVLGVKNGIVNRIQNTHDAVCSKYNSIKTNICDKATASKNYVTSTVESIRTGVRTRVDRTVEKYNAVKTTVLHRYNQGKNTVIVVKNKAYSKYRQAREAKLTKWQKLQYSILFILCLTITLLSFSLMIDVYQGDYDSASRKVDAIYQTSSIIASYSYEAGKIAGSYFLQAAGIFIHYLLLTLQCIGEYTIEWSTVAGQHMGAALWKCTEYSYAGGCVMLNYATTTLTLVAQYLWAGCQMLGRGIFIGSQLAVEYMVIGSKLGAEYAIIGSKKTAEYSVIGSKYAYEYGTIAVKEGSVKFLRGTWYLLTNFRQASSEGIVYLWQGSKYMASMLFTGTQHGGVLLWQGAMYASNSTYHGTISSAKIMGTVLNSTMHLTKDTAITLFFFSKSLTESTVHNIAKGTINTANFTKNLVVAGYSGTALVVSYTYHGTVVGSKYLATGIHTVALKVGHWCHIAVNQYGLKWLYTLVNFLAEWSQIFAQIMWTFIRDLGFYVGHFIFVFSSHIYNVIYIIIAFVYQIFSAVTTVIRMLVNGIVYCVTGVFSAVIFFLHETIFAYMYMLHKYNMYREILFVLFIGVISIYCTGLLHDRREDGDDSANSESDDEDLHDGLDVDLDGPEIKSSCVQPLDLQSLPEKSPETTPSTPMSVCRDLPSEEESDDSEFGFDDGLPDVLDSSDEEEAVAAELGVLSSDNEVAENELDLGDGLEKSDEDLLSGEEVELSGGEVELSDEEIKGELEERMCRLKSERNAES